MKILNIDSFINEDYVYITRNTTHKFKDYPSSFSFDERVYLVSNAVSLHLSNINWDEANYAIKRMESNIGKPLNIVEMVYDTDNKKWFFKLSDGYMVTDYIYAGAVRKYQPEYKPKQHIDRTLESINENYRFFYSNSEMNEDETLLSKPLFKIDDKVMFKINALEINTSKDRKWYHVDSDELEFLENCINVKKELIIKELVYNKYFGYWLVSFKGNNYYFYEDSLRHITPEYKSRQPFKITLD